MALTKLLTDLDNVQALSDSPNETEGLTADQLKAKFDEAGNEIKAYINDVLTEEQDVVNATVAGFDTRITTAEGEIDTLQTLIGSDVNSHTTIGTNDVRATRFVSITPVQVVNTDPANTNWVDVDVSASTSANCYAVCGTIFIRAASAGRGIFVRKNGTTTTGSSTQTATSQVASVYATSAYQVDVDSDRIFEYAASNADVDSVFIFVNGYWEYVD